MLERGRQRREEVSIRTAKQKSSSDKNTPEHLRIFSSPSSRALHNNCEKRNELLRKYLRSENSRESFSFSLVSIRKSFAEEPLDFKSTRKLFDDAQRHDGSHCIFVKCRSFIKAKLIKIYAPEARIISILLIKKIG